MMENVSVKFVCIIASDNVVINGDVIFNKPHKSGMKWVWRATGVQNITIMNTYNIEKYTTRIGLKLSLLWFWHMVVLRKTHVYLTGVLRKNKGEVD